MRTLITLALLAFSAPSFADTLDWRDCTPHTASEAAAYREWLDQFFDPEDKAAADELAASFQRGDLNWADQPCIVQPAAAYRTLPNGTIVKIR